MPNYSKSLLSYSDVHQAFEAAGRLGFVRLSFPTKQAATVWAGRANAYRVLLRKENEKVGKPATSPFDHLVVRRPEDRLSVVIEPRGYAFTGAVGPDGQPIDFSRATLPEAVAIPLARPRTPDDEFEDFLADFKPEPEK